MKSVSKMATNILYQRKYPKKQSPMLLFNLEKQIHNESTHLLQLQLLDRLLVLLMLLLLLVVMLLLRLL